MPLASKSSRRVGTSLFAALGVAVVTSTSWAQESAPQDSAAPESAASIAELCESRPNLRTLTIALEQSGLALYLAQDAPVTLLAPTDQAFAKLSDEFLDDLFDPDNVQALRAVLAYHILPSAQDAAELARVSTVRTIGTQHLFIEARPGGLIVDTNARLLDLDIAAANGVIHTVDTVLLPATRTIEEILDKDDRFSIIHRLLRAADREDMLDEPGRRVTFFAPTNDAIRAISPKLPEVLRRSANRSALIELLEGLIIEGGLTIDEAFARESVESISGAPLRFDASAEGLTVNGMKIGTTNIDSLNGPIHVLDSFSVPDGMRLRTGDSLVIGVNIDSISRSVARQLGAEGDRALEVTGVTRGGGAHRAGIRSGDIILSVDGYPATDRNLRRAKQERGFGGLVDVVVFRDGGTVQFAVPVE